MSGRGNGIMPNVIDLYAGAGGLSLGAARAGFTVTAAVELEPHAILKTFLIPYISVRILWN